MSHEIESLQSLRAHIAAQGDLREVVIQGLDLRGHGEVLTSVSAQGAVFLGCTTEEVIERHIRQTGGLLFPSLPDLPYACYRPGLYDAETLTAGYVRGALNSLSESLDQRVYAHFDAHRKRSTKVPILEALAQRLHDHAIEDALSDYLHGEGQPLKVVAMMGGHGMLRTDPSYRQTARIAHRLTTAEEGYVMATGGGPGAMEATNLGAWMAGYPIEAIDEAISLLSDAPSYRHPAWWETALTVRDSFHERPGESIGIPTWYYGHEPPNLFATHIAKLFSNSLREDGLLTIARHGVIFAPGSAGTIQEIFMDACQNHYGSLGDVSPMVFMDRDYWTTTKPVYPLLRSLAEGRHYADLLTIEDEEEAIVDFIRAHPPQPHQG